MHALEAALVRYREKVAAADAFAERDDNRETEARFEAEDAAASLADAAAAVLEATP